MAFCKSTNGGKDWTRHSISSLQGTVFSLVVNPAKSNVVFACGEHFVNDKLYCKIYKSSDGGNSWSDVSSGLYGSSINSVAIAPLSPNIVYAGGAGGVFKSTNDGLSWTVLNTGFQNVCSIIVHPKSRLVIYAATENDGVFISSDGGETWESLSDGLLTLNMNCLEFDLENRYLYAGSKDKGIFRIKTEEVEEYIVAPAQFSLASNFPNPFKTETTIEYEIPSNFSEDMKNNNL